MTGRFIPITRKVNLIIIGTLIVGIGALTAYLSLRLSGTINENTTSTLENESTIIYESLRVMMLSGRALSVERYAGNLNTRSRGTETRILRPGGEFAFRDNATIDVVNDRLGSEMFSSRTVLAAQRPGLNTAAFERATGFPPVPQSFTELSGDRWYGQIFRPLLNTPMCFSCHGDDHLVRGVVSVRIEVSESIRERNAAILAGSISFFVITIGIGLILSRFMRGVVIGPIRQIREVCLAVTAGDFGQRVGIDRNDEVGSLGETVNKMVQGLHERFELGKYVSSTTLNSVRDDQRGKSVELTLLFSDVRGFTSFSESHEPAEVVECLNALLNTQTRLIIECEGDVDKYVGDEVVALFSGHDAVINAATAAIRIQEELEVRGGHNDLHVGIGLNTGNVILGMVGSELRADYTVIGDTVNVASRLCSAARSGQIIVSEAFRQRLPDGAVVEGPYGLSLKGKADKQRVYKLKSVEKP